MLMLLELPVIGYANAPEWTQGTIDRCKAWFQPQLEETRLSAGGVGLLLAVKGVIELL